MIKPIGFTDSDMSCMMHLSRVIKKRPKELCRHNDIIKKKYCQHTPDGTMIFLKGVSAFWYDIDKDLKDSFFAA